MDVKSSRYVCNLNNDALQKAVTELNEPSDNEERLKRIDQLRDAFINQDANLQLFREDDYFLLRFLRARKFNQERALLLLTNFHKQRQDWPEVFDNVKNPLKIQHLFDAGCFIALDQKALDGSAVCIGRPGKVENMLLTEFVAALTVSIDHLLEDELTQIYGVTVIEDMTYFGLSLAQQMGPLVGKRFLGWLQDAMPMRVKSLNMVNEPKIFDVIFAVVRPFMKDKMKQRLHFHGKSFDLLHTIVDPAVLPPAYSGTGKDLDGDLCQNWKNAIFGEDTSL